MTLPLYDQHGGYWGEHPEHAVSTWQSEVANDKTRQGYWDWVESRLESAAEDAEEEDACPAPSSYTVWDSAYCDSRQEWAPWAAGDVYVHAVDAHAVARTLRRYNPCCLFAVRPTEAGPPPRTPMSHA